MKVRGYMCCSTFLVIKIIPMLLQVLATGLSGLYSDLPRKIVIPSEDWCQITDEDVHNIPEMAMFLNSLEFCNAVAQVTF